jgi:hypothetical protein
MAATVIAGQGQFVRSSSLGSRIDHICRDARDPAGRRRRQSSISKISPGRNSSALQTAPEPTNGWPLNAPAFRPSPSDRSRITAQA